MGYRIVYAPETMPSFGKSDNSRLRTLIAAVFFAFSVIVRSFWPEGTAVLRELILPAQRSVTEQAFVQLCDDLRAGESASSAVEAFCKTVIYETEP